MQLLVQTPRAWVTQAVERFDEVLIDHAHCEKKAAAHATWGVVLAVPLMIVVGSLVAIAGVLGAFAISQATHNSFVFSALFHGTFVLVAVVTMFVARVCGLKLRR